MADEAAGATQLSPAALERLIDSRREFLAFLQKHTGSREAAEDILQAAFVKGIERGGALKDEESAVAWFYRMLRNAVIDHYRKRATSERALEKFVHEIETSEAPVEPLKSEICGCVTSMLHTLKPEYRYALQSVDVEERSLAYLAEAAGITPNNAAVRVHRAREALRKQVTVTCGVCATHGCLDCNCRAGL